MQPDVKDMSRLWDMLDAARTALEFTKGQQFEDFLNDRKTRNAVERNEVDDRFAKYTSPRIWRNSF